MKRVYLLVTLLLFACVIWLFFLHYSFKHSPIDPVLLKQIEYTDKVVHTHSLKSKETVPAVIKAKNIFSPTRGRQSSNDNTHIKDKTPVPKFELIGICSIDTTSGAVVDLKGVSDSNKKHKRRYYRLGTEISNGFILDSIGENSVILKRKNETIELKISRSRHGEKNHKMKKTRTDLTSNKQVVIPHLSRDRNKQMQIQPGINPQ